MSWMHQVAAVVLVGTTLGCLAIYFLVCFCLPLRRRWRRHRKQGQRACPEPTLSELCSSSLKNVASCLVFLRPPADDPFASKACFFVRQQCVVYFKAIWGFGIHILAWRWCGEVIFGRFDECVMAAAGEDADVSISFSDTHLQCLFTLAVAVFVRALPNCVTPSLIQLCQIANAAFQVLRSASVDDFRTLRDHQALETMIAIAMAMFAGGPIVTSGLAATCFITRVAVYVSLLHKSSDDELHMLAQWHGEDHLMMYVSEHLSVAVMTVFLGSALDHAMWEASMASLREQVSSTIQETIRSLLAVLCDAVCSTDEQFLLTEPCLALSNLLGLQGPGNSYEGHSILDFVEGSDRRRVQSHFANAALALGTAQSINTKLVDGKGRSLDMHLYCVAFDDIHGRRCYVIGVKEGEGARGDTVPDRGVTEMFEEFRSSRRQREAEASEGALSIDDSSRSTSSSVLTEDVPEAYIDICSMTLVTWNAAFTMFTGPEEEGRGAFEEWLIAPQAQQVPSILRKICAKFLAEPSGAQMEVPSLVPLGKLLLQPPLAKRAGIKYSADVFVDLQSLRGQSISSDACFVRLKFSSVFTRAENRRTKSPGRSSTASCSTVPSARLAL
eukprot:TRINITY_DN7318_c0_g2_i1.p1 TRINITY_DN7318_c0_g2~~TRINITY_DN7318_c0_g2_i1.p1  ORF type:complete len:613 (+),score=71.47 TRINITY_DN7318_c0_g2_i1:108-1946(+)